VQTSGQTTLTSLGHAMLRLSTPEAREVIIDRWTYRNPLCPSELRDVGNLALVTHDHHDHLGDLLTFSCTSVSPPTPGTTAAPWLARSSYPF
jgi:L-ascorbate metabolism protein UlaG (beta-lactamase superfamily)